MIFRKKFLVYFLIFFFSFNNLFSLENKILLKIDNDIITTIDLYNETNYLLALNKELKNLEKKNIYEIAKNSLIKEKIKTKEILKYTKNLQIDEKFLSDFIRSIYTNQNLNSYESFINYLNKFEVSIEYIKNKIIVNVIWNDLIAQKFSKNIVINIDEIKNDLKTNISKNLKEYLLSEIVFNIPSNSSYETKLELIENDIMQKGFTNAILIHSISNSASNNNGNIGWINENSLNIKIKKAISNLKVGSHTKPIIIPGGFLILKINDVRIVENQDMDTDKKLNEMIQIKRNEQLNNYSNIYFNKVQKEYKIYEN